MNTLVGGLVGKGGIREGGRGMRGVIGVFKKIKIALHTIVKDFLKKD